MNIPYVGEVGTGALIATLLILLLVYIWVAKPKLLKKKTREYASIFMVLVLLGLYTTNSLYILGTPTTVNAGDQVKILSSMSAIKSIYVPQGYTHIIDLRVFWLPEATWAKGQFAYWPMLGLGGISYMSVSSATVKAVDSALLAGSKETRSFIISPTAINNYNIAGATVPAPSLAGVFRLVEVGTIAKCSATGTSCTNALAFSKVTQVTISAPTPPPTPPTTSCTSNAQCPAGQSCRINKCWPTIIVNDGTYCGYSPLPNDFTFYKCKDGSVCTSSACVKSEVIPTPTPYCGDGKCDADEKCGVCADCGACAGVCNNDGTCDPDKGETIANCADCKKPTCTPGFIEQYSCISGKSYKGYESQDCSVTYSQGFPETCTNGCDATTGRCIGGGGVMTCIELNGQVYYTANQTCSKDIPWPSATTAVKCCSETPQPKSTTDWNNILLIMIVLVTILIILAVVASTGRKGGRGRFFKPRITYYPARPNGMYSDWRMDG